jgi:trans-aconitate methyltransferase
VIGDDRAPEGPAELAGLRAEVERAARHYYGSAQQRGIDNRTKQLVVERCLPHLRGPDALELGYVDGLWTERLVERIERLDIVEGAARHVEHARARFGVRPGVRVFHRLFQEFEPDRQYDSIVAGDVIRYLPEPAAFLRRLGGWLRPAGRLIVTVPNSRSFHLRLGALMDLQPTPASANARDREVGNRRAYDRYELRRLLIDAGFEVEALQGCFLKPLSSAQMESWSDELLRGLLQLGDELEDYCWFLVAVGTR